MRAMLRKGMCLRRLFELLLGFCILSGRGPAQGVPRDTSFTMASALESARKQFPSAALTRSPGTSGIIGDSGIVYIRRGGRELHLDLYRPRRDRGRRYPAVLVIHGGGWKSGDRSMEIPMAQRLAAAGYVAAAVEYRLSPEALYPAALCDCRDALRWLRAEADRYSIDTSRIGLVGGSSGGHLAALLGTVQEAGICEGESGPRGRLLRVGAVVDFDGPLDLTDPSESGKDADPARPSSAKRWLGFSYAERPDLWKRASPAFLVNRGTAPLLVVNSAQVRFRAGREETMARMRELGIEGEVREIPDSPHPFWLLAPWDSTAFAYACRFLDRQLKTE